MRYLRKTSNNSEIIALYDLTHMMNILDLVAIGVEALRINSRYSLEKEFIESIRMNF